MRALLIALCLALSMPAAAFRPTLTAGGATAGSGGGGGGGGAFTFVASAGGSSDSSTTTVATSSTLNVASGDLLIAAVTYEDGTFPGPDETVSITDGGSNSFTFDAGDELYFPGSSSINLFLLYKTNATANATATFTATVSASRPFKRLIVMQYRPAGGETASKDISGTRENSGTGTSITSGSFSTTGTDGVVCAADGVYTSGTNSSSTIGGVSADQTKQQDSAFMWCRIVTAALTTQTAATTYSGSNNWAASVIAFKAE